MTGNVIAGVMDAQVEEERILALLLGLIPHAGNGLALYLAFPLSLEPSHDRDWGIRAAAVERGAVGAGAAQILTMP
jgi:hypothetical protein